MQSLTASTPREPRAGFAFSLVATLLPQRQIRSICESFVNYCNLLLQFAKIKKLTKKRKKQLTKTRESNIIAKHLERGVRTLSGRVGRGKYF